MELTLRDIPDFPPPWAFVNLGHAGERRGRSTLRRSFVELKLCFTRAAAELGGPAGLALQRQVREASEPIELWQLRSALLLALPDNTRADSHRLAIEQALAQVFPTLPPAAEQAARVAPSAQAQRPR